MLVNAPWSDAERVLSADVKPVLDYPEREGAIRYFPDFAKDIWTPAAAPMRKTERFKRFVRDIDLVDYWRAKGWPDLCRPMGADDFVCD